MQEFLGQIELDADGLGSVDRRYLLHLHSAPGHTRALSSLATALGLDPSYVQLEVEPFLLHKSLILITNRGRQLTDAGHQRVVGINGGRI